MTPGDNFPNIKEPKEYTFEGYDLGSDFRVLKAVVRIVIYLCLAALIMLFISRPAKADEIAIQTVAYEASSQPFAGQVAVASVIKTRMAETGKDARQVCLKPYQFSCWKNGRPTQKRRLTNKEIKTARAAWNEAQPGSYNHYCRFDCRPRWTAHAKKTARIEDHVFYQL